PKSELAELGPDQICKLGADHHQVEAQDQATATVALQQQRGNFDCVEDGGDGRLPRSETGQPHRAISRSHVAMGGTRKHLSELSRSRAESSPGNGRISRPKFLSDRARHNKALYR